MGTRLVTCNLHSYHGHSNVRIKGPLQIIFIGEETISRPFGTPYLERYFLIRAYADNVEAGMHYTRLSNDGIFVVRKSL